MGLSTKFTSLDQILGDLLSPQLLLDLVGNRSVNVNSLPVLVKNATQKRGTLPSNQTLAKLQLLEELVHDLKLPLSLCGNIILQTNCLDLRAVVAELWEHWHTHSKTRTHATRLFESRPALIISALVSRNIIEISPTVRGDVVTALENLPPGFNLLKEAITSNQAVLNSLGVLDDPKRQKETLNFLIRLQNISRVLIEPLDLAILMSSGFFSSEQVAYTSLVTFKALLAPHGVTSEHAQRIHAEATSIQMQVEQSTIALLQESRDLPTPKIFKATRPKTVGSTPGNTQEPQDTGRGNLSSWFGDLDEVGCKDCCSVTSPAAYFVDLLRLLKNQKAWLPKKDFQVSKIGSASSGAATTKQPPSLLEKLFERRPDLGDILLSCRNTSELVPYIDLVNETLESAIAYLDGKTNVQGLKIQAYNADSDIYTHPNSQLPQDAANTRYEIYDNQISKKVYPSTIFPYDHSKDSLKLYLKSTKTKPADMLRTFRSQAQLSRYPKTNRLLQNPATIDSIYDRAYAADVLGLSSADFVAITGESFYDMRSACLFEGQDQITQDEYRKLSGILPMWYYWGYEDEEPGSGDGEDTILDKEQGRGLTYVKKQLLPRLNVDFATLVRILKTRFLNGCLTVSLIPEAATWNPEKNVPTHLEGFRLRGRGGDSLDIYSCQKLDQFVRLWRRLGWPLEDVDDAICAFSRRDEDDADAEHAMLLTPETIHQLAAVSELSSITTLEPRRIVSLFSPSARYFLELPIIRTVGVREKQSGDEKSSTDYSLLEFLPLLLSSFDLSYEDFMKIQESESLGGRITALDVFRYHRIAEAAKIFEVPVTGISTLLAALGNHNPPLSTPKAFLKTLKVWSRFQAEGWEVENLLYVASAASAQVPTAVTISTTQFISSLMELLGKNKDLVVPVQRPLAGREMTNTGIPAVGSTVSDQLVQLAVRVSFPKIAAKSMQFLLNTSFDGAGNILGKLTRLANNQNAEHQIPGFTGWLFFPGETSIHLECCSEEPQPSITFGGSTYELVKVSEEESSETFSCTVEAPQASLLSASWPSYLRNIRMTFQQPDGQPSDVQPIVFSHETLLEAEKVFGQIRTYSFVLERYALASEELEALMPIFIHSQGLSLVYNLQHYKSARESLVTGGGVVRFAQATQLILATNEFANDNIISLFAQAIGVSKPVAGILLEKNIFHENSSIHGRLKLRLKGLSNAGAQMKMMSRMGLKEDSLPLLFTTFQLPLLGSEEVLYENQRPLTKLVQLLRTSLVHKGLTDALKETQNSLRDNRRRALIHYLLQHPALSSEKAIDEDSLFQFFLIDVKMGTALETTRVKQAISTVQLFVHRCLLGLEDGVEGSLFPQDRWAWMQKYSLWEANRKIFLYPENWADPTLRDSKTELFRSVEDAIMQTNLDEKSIQKIIRSFVYGSDEIANLEIQAFFWDKSTIAQDKHRQLMGEGSFHFLARTRNTPYKYYYRRLDYLSRNALPTTTWTAWEKLPFDIKAHEVDHNGKPLSRSGSYVVPALWNGRLVIFLPQVTVAASATSANGGSAKLTMKIPTSTPAAAGKPASTSQDIELGNAGSSNVTLNIEIKMAWSEYVDGAWTTQKQSQDTLQVAGNGKTPPPFDAFRFNIEYTDDTLCVLVHQNINIQAEWTGTTCLGQFSLQGPRLSLQMRSAMPSRSGLDRPQVSKTAFGLLTRESNNDNVDMTKLASKPTSMLSDTSVWPSLSKPAVEAGAQLSSVTWVLDSSASNDKPLGLVADLSTKKGQGYEPWFTLPKHDSTSQGSQKVDIRESVPFHNSLNNDLRTALSKDSGVDAIYQVMDRSGILEAEETAERDRAYNYAFGRFGYQSQCREDGTPYSIYNWEIGFHLISLLTERLLSLQQFDLAIKYARMVFDPTGTNEPLASTTTQNGQPIPWRPTWRFPPFRDNQTLKAGTLDAIMDKLEPSTGNEKDMMYAILAWRRNPFKPHTVARGRPLAYMKRFVMKYIEALIASGDVYFQQNSLETVHLAIERYIEASHIFGPSPQTLPELGKKSYKSYNDIESEINDFSNASVDLELSFPYFVPFQERGLSQGGDAGTLQSFPLTRYFGVQANQDFMALRRKIDERLFRIRNSLDINGNPRTLSLWDPPLDINSLVKAAAAGPGSDMALIVSGFSTSMPKQRFMYLLQKAYELCAELKQTSGTVLAAIEKSDAEQLQLIQSNNDTGLQRILLDMKNFQKKEAEQSLRQLEESRKSAELRLKFYSQLTGDRVKTPKPTESFEEVGQNIPEPLDRDLRLTRHEVLELSQAGTASMYNSLAASSDEWASILFAVPMPGVNAQPMGMGISYQLPNLGQAWQAEAQQYRAWALKASEDGQLASRIAQWTRQLQERRLQLNLAGREIKGIDKMIEAQSARLSSIEKDIDSQKQVMENLSKVQEFLKSKFTNKELYAWYESSTRSYLYQVYLATMELARKIQMAYLYEQGPDAKGTLAANGYWDQGKRGLQCGDQLWFALKQMELAYLNEKRHDFEITKNVSIRQLSPTSLLSLREIGKTTFDLPEVLFDFDFPGHYLRRIKSVTISFHCVTGAYTNINCTVTLMKHRYRCSASAEGAYLEQPGGKDRRFVSQNVQVPITSVAISSGQVDSGRFELDFNGDSYQPFEGAGVISTWRLRLPKKFRQFDYRTISDVVMQIRYTAKDGGDSLATSAMEGVQKYLEQVASASEVRGMSALLDIRNEYVDSWFAFTSARKGTELNTSDTRVLAIKDVKDRLPFYTRASDVNVTVRGLTLYTKGPEMTDINIYVSSSRENFDEGVLFGFTENLGGLQTYRPVPADKLKKGSRPQGKLDVVYGSGNPWYITFKSADGKDCSTPTDLFIAVNYSISVVQTPE